MKFTFLSALVLGFLASTVFSMEAPRDKGKEKIYDDEEDQGEDQTALLPPEIKTGIVEDPFYGLNIKDLANLRATSKDWKDAADPSFLAEKEATEKLKEIGAKVERNRQRRIRKISFPDTIITDAMLGEIEPYLAKLRMLDFLDLRLMEITDRGLVHLKDLHHLKTLYLSSTKITDEGLVSLRGLENLELLSLQRTQVTGKGFSHLRNLKNLQYLYLNSNSQVSDAGLSQLRDLQHLRHITLYRTPVTDKAIDEFHRYRQDKGWKAVDLTR